MIFAGAGERVELAHKATSRQNFAAGALRAAHFVAARRAAGARRPRRHARRARAAYSSRGAGDARILFDLSGTRALVTGGGSGLGSRDRPRPRRAPVRASSSTAATATSSRPPPRRSRATASTRRVAPFDVTDAGGGRRGRRGRRARAGPDRHPRQQCRDEPAQAARDVHARGMARADGGESRRSVPRHARAAAGDEGAPARQDRQRLLARVRPRTAEHRSLCGEQGRAQDADARARRGARAAQRPGERHLAGILQDRDERARSSPTPSSRRGSRAARRPAAGASRRRSPARPCSSRRPRPTT